MKASKLIRAVAAAAVASAVAVALAGCGSSGSAAKQIAVRRILRMKARALLLLQDQGLITLKDGTGLSATKNDIEENPYNIDIVETEAASVPRTLSDVNMGVVNGNYAIGAGIDTSTALAKEATDSEAADKYANVVAVRDGDEDSAQGSRLSLPRCRALRCATSSTLPTVVRLCQWEAPSDVEIPDATGRRRRSSRWARLRLPRPLRFSPKAKDILAEHGYTLEVVGVL